MIDKISFIILAMIIAYIGYSAVIAISDNVMKAAV